MPSLITTPLPVITRLGQTSPTTHWRYLEEDESAFNPIVFDEKALAKQGLIKGLAEAGRGNTFFLSYQNKELVLRHYHRGGLAQRISKDRYCYTGLERTRAMSEFGVLVKLYEQGLPVPKPYACRVSRQGMCYTASLVSALIPGQTMAAALKSDNGLSDSQWNSIGKTIASFHQHGLYHADLNAHNIILNNSDTVSLIDFDRARFRSSETISADSGWCLANILRLKRSVLKLSVKQDNFKILQQGWIESLNLK